MRVEIRPAVPAGPELELAQQGLNVKITFETHEKNGQKWTTVVATEPTTEPPTVLPALMRCPRCCPEANHLVPYTGIHKPGGIQYTRTEIECVIAQHAMDEYHRDLLRFLLSETNRAYVR